MSTNLESLDAEARRLAQEIGDGPSWAATLGAVAAAASRDDLGTLVVARAVLARALSERQAEQSRKLAEDAERERIEARQRVQRYQAARVGRRSQRFGRLRDQLAVRLITSAIYSGAVAYLVFASVGISPWSTAVAVFQLCLVTVAASVVFDWFAFSGGGSLPSRDPAGLLRGLSTFTGVLIGLVPWFELIALQGARRPDDVNWGATFSLGPIHTYWVAAVLPMTLSLSWMIGGLIEVAVDGSGRRSFNARLANLQRFLNPLAWLGAVSAVSAALTSGIPQLAYVISRSLIAVRALPYWEVPGLSTDGTTLVIVGMLAPMLSYAAGAIQKRSERLAIVSAVAGALLGLASLFFNQLHLVVWIITWAISLFR